MFKKFATLNLTEKIFQMRRFVNDTFISTEHVSVAVGLILNNMVKTSKEAINFANLSECFLFFMVLLYSKQNVQVANSYEVVSHLGQVLQNIAHLKTVAVDHRNIATESNPKKIHPKAKAEFIMDLIQGINICMEAAIENEGPACLNVDNLELLGYILDEIEEPSADEIIVKEGLNILGVII